MAIAFWHGVGGLHGMAGRALERIRGAVRDGRYDFTAHAVEEMAEDALGLVDVEAALQNGDLVRRQTDDPRGTRYTVLGLAVDGTTRVGIVGRFTTLARFLVITVYRVGEERS